MLQIIAALITALILSFVFSRIFAVLVDKYAESSRETTNLITSLFPLGALVVWVGSAAILMSFGSVNYTSHALLSMLSIETQINGIVEYGILFPTLLVAILPVLAGYLAIYPYMEAADVSPKKEALVQVTQTSILCVSFAYGVIGLAILIVNLLSEIKTLYAAQFTVLLIGGLLGGIAWYRYAPWWYQTITDPESINETGSVATVVDNLGLPSDQTWVIPGAGFFDHAAIVRGTANSQHVFICEQLLEEGSKEVGYGIFAILSSLEEKQFRLFHVSSFLVFVVTASLGGASVILSIFPYYSTITQATVLVVVLIALLVIRILVGRRLVYISDQIAAEKTSQEHVLSALQWLDENDIQSSHNIFGRLRALPSIDKRIERIESPGQ